MTNNQNLDQLWEHTKDIWQNGFMGVDVGSILTALGIFLAFLVIRGVFSKYVLYKLQAWTEKTTTNIDDKIAEALIPPIRFIPVILGIFFAGQYLQLEGAALDIFWQVERSLIAFTMFWALHRAVEPISQGMKPLQKLLTKTMVGWIFKTARVLIIFVGAAVILEIWGIAIGPLLAGLGLFGAAVALGAQDLFKNLIAGFSIIAEKRFHPGEWIRVDGIVEGIVEEIGFRSTHVRRFDKAPVHVPNSQLSDAAITNFSRMTHRRIYWKIGVTYDTTTAQLQTIRDGIMDYIEKNQDFARAEEVSTFVRVDSFNASSIDIMVYCFTNTTNWGEWLAIKENFAFEIKKIVEKDAGSAFAFPSQSLYIESLPGDTAEVFEPPKAKKKPVKKKAA